LMSTLTGSAEVTSGHSSSKESLQSFFQWRITRIIIK
jgi:hypothetical protein